MPDKPYSCWTDSPKRHPWEEIIDVACGYYDRRRDARCEGCHRSTLPDPEEQLAALGSLGRARGSLNK